MPPHSRDVVTVSAVVATRPRADCSSLEGHTSLSPALVDYGSTLAACVVDGARDWQQSRPSDL